MTFEYDYDAADRLIEEETSDPALGSRTISYEYDPVGNRMTRNECTDAGPCVSTEYSYDDNDRLLTENGYAYTYDNNGNMLTKTVNGVETHDRVSLQYNALNQVTRANISSPQGASVIDYAYDHDGIRIGKTVNGTEITNYVVDKNRPYAQVLEEDHLSGGLSAVTSYVYGDGLISGTIDGTLTQYYHMDGMGSVRGLSDSSGVMTDRYNYDAYGMLVDSSGASANPYRYRGEQYDADLSSYYLRARYYQPGTGRFLTTDPVEGTQAQPISLHRYLYANANPISYTDPSGRFSTMDAVITLGVMGVLAVIPSDVDYVAYFVTKNSKPDDDLRDCEFSVYVNRPHGHGAGKAIVNPNADVGPVGHAYFLLKDHEKQESIAGLSPYFSGMFGPQNPHYFFWWVKGRIHDEKSHHPSHGYSESLTFEITRRQYKLIHFWIEYHRSRPVYNLLTNNCTDFVLNAAARGGIALPYHDGFLSNPQHLADAISFYHQLSESEQAALLELAGYGIFLEHAPGVRK